MEKKGSVNGPKPKEQGTWVRLPRAIKNPNKETDVRGTEIRREPIQVTDPQPSKRISASQDDVVCVLFIFLFFYFEPKSLTFFVNSAQIVHGLTNFTF